MTTHTVNSNTDSMSEQELLTRQTLARLGTRAYQAPAMLGALGLGTAAVLGVIAGDGLRHLWHSYLLAVCFFTSLSLGALIFIALQYITRAGWSVVVRRLSEVFAVTIVATGVLFLPILLSVLSGASALYLWNDPVLAKTDELIRIKVPYLNAWFFTLRSFFYIGVWVFLARKFWQESLKQDETGDAATTSRLEALSAPTLILFALTVTFASIDWLMSLDPHWFSSIFGVYFFSGCMVGFLAALNLVIILLQQRLGLLPMVTVEHRHDLGKLMYGFMCFWAYMAFSQYLLIWYANVPEETVWYQVRQSGTWGAVSLVLIAGHFALPFLGLMRRQLKRNPKVLAAWSCLLLAMHAVDLYWLIFPTLEPAGPTVPLITICCLLGVGGLYVSAWLAIAGQRPLIPLHDPRLPESLAFHNV